MCGWPRKPPTDPAVDPDPAGTDLADLAARVEAAWTDLQCAISAVDAAIVAARSRRRAARPSSTTCATRSSPSPRSASSRPSPAAPSAPSRPRPRCSWPRRTPRRAAAAARREEARRAAGHPTGLTPPQTVDQRRAAARLVLGSAVNLVPRFEPRNPTSWRLPSAGRWPRSGVEEWVQGVAECGAGSPAWTGSVACTRPSAAPASSLAARQLPFRRATRGWRRSSPSHSSRRASTSASSLTTPCPSTLGPVSGLVVDEWDEVIPGTRRDDRHRGALRPAGLRAAAGAALAVTPVVTGAWSWDDLVGVVNDTLDRAQLRAVEPDHLGLSATGTCCRRC